MLNSRAYHVFSLLLFMMTNTVAMWEEICIQISIQLKQIPTYHKRKKKSKHKSSNYIPIIFLFNFLELQRFTFSRSLKRIKISKRCPLYVPCLPKRKQIPFTLLSTAADVYYQQLNKVQIQITYFRWPVLA